MQSLVLIIMVLAFSFGAFSQGTATADNFSVRKDTGIISAASRPFLATSALLDAAINSINSRNSLIKKEAYRNKIAAFNNPTSSDLGFNLEHELQSAIKPLLSKAKSTNPDKFA